MSNEREILEKIEECEKMLIYLEDNKTGLYLCDSDEYLCSVRAIARMESILETSFIEQAREWYRRELKAYKQELIEELQKD